MLVSKWGNSLAIRLPASVVEALALSEGDDIEVIIVEDRVFKVKKKPGRDEMLRKLRKYRGKLPSDFSFDRDDVYERRGNKSDSINHRNLECCCCESLF